MVTSDPQAVSWSVELRSSGSVRVDVRRWRSWLHGVIAVYMGLISVAILLLGDGVGIRVVGVLLALITVPLLVMAVQQILRLGSWAPPVVVVDADGLTVRHGYLHVPWSDLTGVTAYTANRNSWVSVGMSEQCYDAWLARRSWVLRVLARRPRRRTYGVVNLPPNLAVDAEAFARWLTDEATERRLAEIRQLRRDLEVGVMEAERLAAESEAAARADGS